MIVLAVASSGIASLLLPGGRTAHSRFVIPLELVENSTCGIKQNTHLAELLQQVQLIIWDEAPMTQKYAFEALDKTLRDILGYKNPEKRNAIFGGVTVLLGGPRCGRRDCESQKKEDEDEATWIEIAEDSIINAAESPIKETFPDFTTRKSDGAYLKERGDPNTKK
ncbi:ATP-dependent DNA helicase PIF1-like protein [Tanacetum coccineum]|uniref:ATP-dependent DNA helicase n=1 Tax=Tanacetum coccineum TaxID=301880 RepID=A0ABQ5DF16_9ASTR